MFSTFLGVKAGPVVPKFPDVPLHVPCAPTWAEAEPAKKNISPNDPSATFRILSASGRDSSLHLGVLEEPWVPILAFEESEEFGDQSLASSRRRRPRRIFSWTVATSADRDLFFQDHRTPSGISQA